MLKHMHARMSVRIIARMSVRILAYHNNRKSKNLSKTKDIIQQQKRSELSNLNIIGVVPVLMSGILDSVLVKKIITFYSSCVEYLFCQECPTTNKLWQYFVINDWRMSQYAETHACVL